MKFLDDITEIEDILFQGLLKFHHLGGRNGSAGNSGERFQLSSFAASTSCRWCCCWLRQPSAAGIC
jgi:hypothetical protein